MSFLKLAKWYISETTKESENFVDAGKIAVLISDRASDWNKAAICAAEEASKRPRLRTHRCYALFPEKRPPQTVMQMSTEDWNALAIKKRQESDPHS